MKRLGEVRRFTPASILRFVGRSVLQPWMWFGIGLLAVSFYGFLTMLSWYPVGFVVPATSLAYVAGPLGAQFFLRERLSATRWAGILLIFVGVALAWVDDVPRTLSAVALRDAGRDAVFLLALVPLALYLFGAWAAIRFFGRPRQTTASVRRDSLRRRASSNPCVDSTAARTKISPASAGRTTPTTKFYLR